MNNLNNYKNIYNWLKPVSKKKDFPKSRYSELIINKGKLIGWDDIGSGIEYQLKDCSINESERIDFLNYISMLLSNTNYKNNEHYLKFWKLIQNQADLNSPKFSSHGIDHSLRVVKDMLILTGIMEQKSSKSEQKSSKSEQKSSKSDFQKKTLFMTQLKKKYPSVYSNDRIINSIIWCGLLHDIGYAEFDLCSKEYKFKNKKDLLEEQRFIFNLLQTSLCNGMFKDTELCNYDLNDYHSIKKAGNKTLWDLDPTKTYLKKVKSTKKQKKSSNTPKSAKKLIKMFEKKTLKSIPNYPCTDNIGFNKKYYRKNKFLHALLGYRALFDIELHYELLWPKFREDVLMSIKYHNFDDPSIKEYIPSKQGNFFTIGIHKDTKILENEYELLSKKEKKLIKKEEFNLGVERTYIEASLETSPLLALVRLADNLDITYERLTTEQRCPIIILYQKWFRERYMTLLEESEDTATLFNTGKIGKVVGGKELNKLFNEEKNIEWQKLETKYNDSNLNVTILKLLKDNTNYNEYLFQYGSWIIKSLSYYITNDFKLYIKIDLNDIPEDKLDIRYNWKAGIDQLVRMNSAFKSIKFKGKQLNENTYITLLNKQILLNELDSISTYEEFISKF